MVSSSHPSISTENESPAMEEEEVRRGEEATEHIPHESYDVEGRLLPFNNPGLLERNIGFQYRTTRSGSKY